MAQGTVRTNPPYAWVSSRCRKKRRTRNFILSLVTPVSSGKAEGNGNMHITLCDFIVPWDTLSTTQKKSLNHRYQMGCECKVSCHHLLQVDCQGLIPDFPRASQPTGSWLRTGLWGGVVCPQVRVSSQALLGGKGNLTTWAAASRKGAF